MDMTGKTVLVTGAANGIGLATALRYAEYGVQAVACLDIDEAGARDTAARLEKLGVKALAIPLDLGDVGQIKAAYAQVVETFGRLDACAHIGGYSWRGETLDVTEEQWDAVINANLRSTFFCCQAALKVMYAQGSGAIVNMSADAAFFPIHGFAVQAAGKGGIVNMTQTLAHEAARRGVRVNVVSPGITKVERKGSHRPAEPVVRRDETMAPAATSSEVLTNQTAGGRWMTSVEIADTFVFLSSDAASGVNGSLLFVNGGGYFSLQY
jgi:NAD(P)-dependent dehydrogenase (short-subunit alcohol dehydrogenase family)